MKPVAGKLGGMNRVEQGNEQFECALIIPLQSVDGLGPDTTARGVQSVVNSKP